MSKPKTSPESRKPTSSPASEAGHTLSDSPDGATGLFGQALAPANRSASPASAAAPKTSATCGPCGSGSSASAALSSSLGNRLRLRLGTVGSIEYRQTWKRQATPSGRWYWAHTASGHRTGGSDCTGWATPATRDDHAQGLGHNPETRSDSLGTTAARLSAWPTPNCDDANNATRDSGQFQSLTRIACWPTPRAEDSEQTGAHRGIPDTINDAIRGAMPSGSDAPTGKRGERLTLAPEFALWLLGYPIAWARCADRVTLSARRRRRSS